MTEPAEADREAITRKLDEMDVSISPDELDELAATYPALMSWMLLVEELGRDESR